MSTAPANSSRPVPPKTYPREQNKAGKASQKAQLAATYCHPLPLIPRPPPIPSPSPSRLAALASIFRSAPSATLENPWCTGVWDPYTGTVWVTEPKDVDILWTRGFFGKGSLSRSEPSWWKRKVREEMGGGNFLSAEEVTALRRQERKDFKIARAKAAVATVEAAERALLLSLPTDPTSTSSPSSSTAALIPDEVVKPVRPGNTKYGNERELLEEELARQEEVEAKTENLEHLQLIPEEVWFLAWGLGCLNVLSPTENQPIPLPHLFHLLTSPILTSIPAIISPTPSFAHLRPDHPFLVSYAAYHHYRSLGWVVKTGIKFCVDWLLYKRGVVFSHAEFAIVVIPTYSNPADKETSPHKRELENVERMDWAWFSTINRVNSQVKKTLVLCYVVIPPCGDSVREEFVGGDPESWGRYRIQEVVFRRFMPARMRD